MKKLSLVTSAAAFVPSSRRAVDLLKEWIEDDKNLSTLCTLTRARWNNFHPNTWFALKRRSGVFKPNRETGRINIIDDFSRSWNDCTKLFADKFRHEVMIAIEMMFRPERFIKQFNQTMDEIFGSATFIPFQRVIIMSGFFSEEREYADVRVKNAFREIGNFVIGEMNNVMTSISVLISAGSALPKETSPNIEEAKIKPLRCSKLPVIDFTKSQFVQFVALKEDHFVNYKKSGDSLVPCQLHYQFNCPNGRTCDKYHINKEDVIVYEHWITSYRQALIKLTNDGIVKRILFIDADNALKIAAPFFKNNAVEDDEIFVFLGNHCKGSISNTIMVEYNLIYNAFIVPTLLVSKDSADQLMTREVLWLHEQLAKDIDFIFISGDGFVDTLGSMVMLQRNGIIVKAETNYVDAWNREFLRMIQNEEAEWKLCLPSRITQEILVNNDKCCALKINGMPCKRDKWLNYNTCEFHTNDAT